LNRKTYGVVEKRKNGEVSLKAEACAVASANPARIDDFMIALLYPICFDGVALIAAWKQRSRSDSFDFRRRSEKQISRTALASPHRLGSLLDI
jgi:hypothetical protein